MVELEGQIIRQNQLFGQDGNGRVSQFSTRIDVFCILLFFSPKIESVSYVCPLFRGVKIDFRGVELVLICLVAFKLILMGKVKNLLFDIFLFKLKKI